MVEFLSPDAIRMLARHTACASARQLPEVLQSTVDVPSRGDTRWKTHTNGGNEQEEGQTPLIRKPPARPPRARSSSRGVQSRESVVERLSRAGEVYERRRVEKQNDTREHRPTINSRSAQLAKRVDPIEKRSERLQRLRNQCVEEARQQKDQEEMESCTGRPAILPCSKGLNRGKDSMKQWDQWRKQRIAEGVQQREQAEERECSFRPQLCPGTQRLAKLHNFQSSDRIAFPPRPRTSSQTRKLSIPSSQTSDRGGPASAHRLAQPATFEQLTFSSANEQGADASRELQAGFDVSALKDVGWLGGELASSDLGSASGTASMSSLADMTVVCTARSASVPAIPHSWSQRSLHGQSDAEPHNSATASRAQPSSTAMLARCGRAAAAGPALPLEKAWSTTNVGAYSSEFEDVLMASLGTEKWDESSNWSVC